jgi:adenine-specific DNA methylase
VWTYGEVLSVGPKTLYVRWESGLCQRIHKERHAREGARGKGDVMAEGVKCQICGGAIPSGEHMGGHTALCAGVLSLALGDMRHALQELADAAETYASSDQDMPSHDEDEEHFDRALAAARALLSPGGT